MFVSYFLVRPSHDEDELVWGEFGVSTWGFVSMLYLSESRWLVPGTYEDNE